MNYIYVGEPRIIPPLSSRPRTATKLACFQWFHQERQMSYVLSDLHTKPAGVIQLKSQMQSSGPTQLLEVPGCFIPKLLISTQRKAASKHLSYQWDHSPDVCGLKFHCWDLLNLKLLKSHSELGYRNAVQTGSQLTLECIEKGQVFIDFFNKRFNYFPF